MTYTEDELRTSFTEEQLAFLLEVPTEIHHVQEITFKAQKHSRLVDVDPGVALYVNSCSPEEVAVLNSADLFTPAGRGGNEDAHDLEQRKLIATTGEYDDLIGALPALEAARPFTERFAGSTDGSIVDRYDLPEGVTFHGDPPLALAADAVPGQDWVCVVPPDDPATVRELLLDGKKVVAELTVLDQPCEILRSVPNVLNGLTLYHLAPSDENVYVPSCYDAMADERHYEQLAAGTFNPSFGKTRRRPRSWTRFKPKVKSDNRYEGEVINKPNFLLACKRKKLPAAKEGYVKVERPFAFCDLDPDGNDFLPRLVYQCGVNGWKIEYDEDIGWYVE